MLKNSLKRNFSQHDVHIYRRRHLQCELRWQCRPEHVPPDRLEVFVRLDQLMKPKEAARLPYSE